jgi:diguanylate cyclase (GGDEF)-like protein
MASGMFYFATMHVLSQGVAEAPLAGYSLMPLLIVSMLGVFPLTLDWGIALIATIMIFFLGLEASQSQLMTAYTANMLWIFLMLGGISLWVQSSHLLMLLRLYRESTLDPLTGLINRRVLMRRLISEIAHISERETNFCIMMFDLDRFKRINDNYGHLIGDKVLKATAVVLQAGLREHDIVARFGGEEFVAVLPNCKSKEAVAIAERIRATYYDTHLTAPNGDDIQLSISVGVTEYEPGEVIDVTLNRVDELLYKAKEMGRNRVIRSVVVSVAN